VTGSGAQVLINLIWGAVLITLIVCVAACVIALNHHGGDR
jgi:hypothetical protein